MLFSGRLTSDAEVRNVKGDKKVTGFTVAINDRFKTKEGEKKEITSYVECSYWINAGLAEYLLKGTIVEIFGRMGARAWVNKDGEAQASLACNVQTIKLLGGSGKKSLETAFTDVVSSTTVYNDIKKDEDDLPF